MIERTCPSDVAFHESRRSDQPTLPKFAGGRN